MTKYNQVDIDRLKTLWKEDPNKSEQACKLFSILCYETGITIQMMQNCQTFGPNDKFVSMRIKNMAAALMTYKLWSTTYEDHSKPFEEWTKDNDNCAWPYLMDKPLDNNIDIAAEFV